MSDTLALVRACVARGEVRVSQHGSEELDADRISVDDVVGSTADAMLVEDYPAASKGPGVLLLHRDRTGQPVHVVWGFARGTTSPAVLVTAYRPDARRWSADFMNRRRP